MQLAVGTSLATIVITSISSVRAHHKRGAVLWPVVWSLSPGILGALVRAKVADWLPSDTLRIVFALFVLSIAAQMAFAAKPAAPWSTRLSGHVGTGGVIGGLSAIVGIGGGSRAISYLVQYRYAPSGRYFFSLRVADCVIWQRSGLSYNGWGHAPVPAWRFGLYLWPGADQIALANMWTAPLGAKLTHTLPAMLKRVFAGFAVGWAEDAFELIDSKQPRKAAP